MVVKSDIQADTRQWYVRMESGGAVFGPVRTSGLLVWTTQGRVLPDDEVSEDQIHWRAAQELPELEMNMLIAHPNGTFIGPFHKDALQVLIQEGKIPPDAKPFPKEELAERMAARQMTLFGEEEPAPVPEKTAAKSRRRPKPAQKPLAEAESRMAGDEEDLRPQLAELHDLLEEQKRENASLQARLEDAEAACAEAERAKAEAEAEAERAKAEAEKKQAEVEAEAEAEKAEAEKAAAAARAEKTALEERAKAAEEALAATKAEAEKTKAEAEKEKAEAEKARESAENGRSELEQKAKDAEAEQASLRWKLSAAEAEIAERRACVEKAMAEEAEARDALAKAEESAAEAQKVQAEALEAKTRQCAELQSQLQEKTRRCDAAWGKLADMEADFAEERVALETRISAAAQTAEAERANLEAKLAAAVESAAEKDARLEASLREYAELLSFSNQRDTDYQAQIAELRTRLGVSPMSSNPISTPLNK